MSGDVYTLQGSDGGHDWRAIVAPATILRPGAPSLTGSVTMALPLDGVDLAVARLRMLTLLIGGIVIVVCALLGWLAIRRSFQPLVEVEETAAAIAAGDLSRRIPERPASTEVGRLTGSLNGMLTQIESAFRAREASEARTRRFAADASHELRTPLAAIRGFAELYRQGAVPAEDVPRTMRRIEDEATRMGGLVEDLLLLARLDERRPAQAEPVDLAVLAGDAVHDVRGLDPDRPVRLTGLQPGSGPVPAVVVGDEGGLRQVVTNLVANAVRHTPAGTPVEVAVGVEPPSQFAPGRDEPGCAVLEVRDHGPGLPPEEAGKVFQRFYRVDSSRRRGTGGGSGLGLSIVSAVTPLTAEPSTSGPRRAGVRPSASRCRWFPDMTPGRHPGSALRELSVSPEALSSGMASNGVIRRREVTDHVLLPRARAGSPARALGEPEHHGHPGHAGVRRRTSR